MRLSKEPTKVVIPARFGSTRLPGKPLIDLAGKPMVVRVYEAVNSSLPEAEVIVAVDDLCVQEVLAKHQIPSIMTSDRWESGTDRVAEVARKLDWSADSLVINVQGDEPLVPPELLIAFERFCLDRGALQMASISAPIESISEVADPNIVKLVTRRDGTAINFSRAPIPYSRDQKFEDWDLKHYRRHLGIYAYRNDTLQTLTQTPICELEEIEKLEQLRAIWLDIPIAILTWSSSPPGGIDTESDVSRVRAYLEGQVW